MYSRGKVELVLVVGRIQGALQEREAICALKAGDIAALEVLYRLHKRAVFGIAYGIVCSNDLAEDVTQQVFLEVFTSIKRYNDQRPFRPWLCRIAVYLCRDENRKEGRRYKGQIPLEDAPDIPSPPSDCPQRRAENSELGAAIRQAVTGLSAEHREVIVLSSQGYSGAEMAEILDAPEGTVKSRLSVARRSLRGALAGHAPHGPEEGGHEG